MENTPAQPPNPVPPATTPVPSAPAQGEVVAGYVPVPPNQMPQVSGQTKGGTPWYVWVLASCGGCVLLIIVLSIVGIVALNPAKKLADLEDSTFKTEISDTGTAVINCINDGKSKGVDATKIYSFDGCANKTFLFDGHYSSKAILATTNLLVNDTKTKICVFTAYTKPGNQKESVISWDSVSQSVSTSGSKTCN